MNSHSSPRIVFRLVTASAFAGMILSAPPVGAETPAVISTRIDSVTVFRDQAEVVRTARVAKTKTVRTVRVVDLPTSLVPGSLHLETDSGTTVHSLRLVKSDKASTGTPRSAGRESSSSVDAELVFERDRVAHRMAVIEQDLATIEKLVDFSADRGNQDLNRATLDVEALTGLAKFTMATRRDLAEEYFLAKGELGSVERRIVASENKRRELESKRQSPGREVWIELTSPSGGELRLVYSVGGVRWNPSYTVRMIAPQDFAGHPDAVKNDALKDGVGGDSVDGGQPAPRTPVGRDPADVAAGKKRFVLQFDAKVIQRSGEDWTNVALTFATMEPQSMSSAPRLTPLRIRASATAENSPGPGARSRSGDSTRPTPRHWYDPERQRRDLAINAEAGQRQVREFTTIAGERRSIAEDAESNIADASYAVAARTNVASRPEEQTVTVFIQQVAGELYHVVTPLLSSFAYREAKLTHSLGQSMIAGQAEVYFAGKHVGRTTIPPTVTGQDFVVGFGLDRKIRTRRELFSREESIRGGNRQTAVNYRLVVSNYHDSDVEIRLFDRIPVTPQDTAINVELATAAADRISKDALYRRVDYPVGILRWDLTVPAGRVASDAFDFHYRYTVEMDREQTITGEGMIDRMEADYRFDKLRGGGGGMGGGMGGAAF